MAGLLGAAICSCALAQLADGLIRQGVRLNLVMGIGVMGGFTALVFVLALRPSLSLTESTLVIRNPMRTYRVDLLDVIDVWPGYSGVVVATRGQAEISVWAVQKSNLAAWFNS